LDTRFGAEERQPHLRDCPEWEEIKDLEARQKELKRRLRKVTDPPERRRLEQEIKVLDWRLQRLRVRSHASGSWIRESLGSRRGLL
jgi:hypothetical protein